MVSSSRFPSCIEILEGRIAPAAIFSYTDANGNKVTITSSKGAIDALDTLVTLEDLGGGRSTLLALDLTNPLFKGTNLTIDVTDQSGLDVGNLLHTSIGFINAGGNDLGKVVVDGDINKIVAGDTNSLTAGISSLTVESWGTTDVTAGYQAVEFDSIVIGAITTLTVKGDFTNGYLHVIGSDTNRTDGIAPKTNSHGKIGTLSIGGSIIGVDRDNAGSIVTSGDIGKLTVTGSVKGFISNTPPTTPITSANENNQKENGKVFAGGKMGTVSIGGDIIGGDGYESGQVASAFGMSTATVGGNIKGGFGEDSGALGAGGVLGKVTVTGSVIGGDGLRSGSILSTSSMLAVKIGGNLEGGNGDKSGFIASAGTLQSVTITGNVLGGDGDESGSLGAFGAVGPVSIGGNVFGGDGDYSGQILSGTTIKSVIINGDFAGGDGYESGAIGSLRGLGPILIKGSMFAGTGDRSGIIATDGSSISHLDAVSYNASITSVTILGSLYGTGRGASGLPDPNFEGGDSAGSIVSGGTLGTVVVGGHVEGGEGSYTGVIRAYDSIKSVSIGGNLRGGDGSASSYSGSIMAGGKISSVIIGAGASGGSLIGGDGYYSGSITSDLELTKVVINGSVLAGAGNYSANIEAYHSEPVESGSPDVVANIGSIFIKGSLLGGSSGGSASYAANIYSEGKIGSIVIGDPNSSDTETGSFTGGVASNTGAIISGGDIGSIKVKLSMIGGSGNDSGKISSGGKIGSVSIGGNLSGGTGNYNPTSGFTNELGQIYAQGAIGDVSIGAIIGGDGEYSAAIRGLSIKSLKTNSIAGGDGVGSASVVAYSQDIGLIDVKYSISAGAEMRSAWISAQGNINSFKAGYVLGDADYRVVVTAGQALKSITIAEEVEYADFLAGYSPDRVGINPGAQIGTVVIGTGTGPGNVKGVNIVAGVQTGSSTNPGDDGVFGTPDDDLIKTSISAPAVIPKIASIIIKGTIEDTDSSSDHFGFAAKSIGTVKVNGVTIALTPGPSNDGPIDLSSGGDTTIFEAGKTLSMGG